MICLSGKTRGTCDDALCPSAGVCHCGCGDVRPVTKQGHTRDAWTRGFPIMYANGHNPDALRSDRHLHDVPIDRIRPLAQWLVVNAGGLAPAQALSGLSRGTLDVVLYSKGKQFAASKTSAAIVSAVLAIRAHRNPDSPHTPRIALAPESGMAPPPERVRNTRQQRESRARRSVA